jgi:succinyl-CoA synthetase beta subunit
MKIHEYQAKGILAKYGVPVPQGEVIFNASEAAGVAQRLGGGTVVVKAQIHAGGRGKGGGVKVVKGADEARAAAEKMLGMNLVTYQTGPSGQKVQRVLIEQGLRIKRELYLGIVLDRSSERLVVMVSPDGGVEIEKVAEQTPERIFKEFVHPGLGLAAYQARKLAFALGLAGPQIAQATKMMMSLYQAFVAADASLLEINPLIETEDGSLLALDAKMNFDDNALFRHPDFKELRDTAEEDPLEVEASKYSLNYIKLDGTIGCMVNGAGLAMATMDIIKLAGGEPANFLDVGGGANAEQIKNAFRILMADTSVRAVLINIFGGILRCDVLAEGVIAAVKDLGVRVPIVIRMEGTNVEKGKQMLKESGLDFETADDMSEAARKVVAAAGRARAGRAHL